ncbi:MAG: hypothetical protein LBS31_10230 [Candidatus Adiutrix sp.]|jgi:flagellar basal-body rod modification protein FlgD|nr:hypothetical protein [Candidatus Adiutrix sp.]
MTIYSASNPPSGNQTPLTAWTKETVPVTDGSERQMGKDSFLLLLLTQLQNQDPTNPMENTEMTAQLAQFSQLEQLTNMSGAITTMTSYIQAQNQFQTLTLIGKNVLAENDQLSVTDGKTDVEASLVTTEACSVKVYILNSKGESVRTLDLGLREPGEHAIEWDGRNTKGQLVDDGVYTFQVTATNLSGEVLDDGVYPQVSGKITSVSFDASGQPIIHMGHASLALGQVIQILEGSSLSGEEPDGESEGGEAEEV